VALLASYLHPFADMIAEARRSTGAVGDVPGMPTIDELQVFATNAASFLSRAESVHILGNFRTNRGWLFVCEMRMPNSTSPIQVLFHSRWKPKGYYALYQGTLTRFNPDEWEMEYAVIMPPTAWDEGRAWEGVK
jgi:hypothetical protein